MPALIALFVVAFALQGRPSALRTRTIADAFDPARAYGAPSVRGSLFELGESFPRRRPGSPGDAALARRVARGLRAAGFAVERTRAEGATVDGDRTLETVVGVRPGVSDRRIVLLAHRDALSTPGLAELSGTAALLELARIFRTREPSGEAPTAEPGRPRLIGRDLRKTLVLVSTSGGSGGAAGAREWARTADPAKIDAVLVLGDLASRVTAKPWVVPWSNGRAQPPLRWRRTVDVAVRQETGRDPGRLARERAVDPQGGAADRQRAGGGQPRGPSGRAAPGLGRARTGARRGGRAAADGRVRPRDAARGDGARRRRRARSRAARSVRRAAGRHRDHAQRPPGLGRAPARVLPPAARAADRARQLLPRAPAPAADGRLAGLDARRRPRGAAGVGLAAAAGHRRRAARAARAGAARGPAAGDRRARWRSPRRGWRWPPGCCWRGC